METNTLASRLERTPEKSEEIAILREAARQLGPLSYCGPWLSQQIAGIETDIRSDFFPQIDLESTKRLCGEMLTNAHDKAGEIVAAAERQAKATIDAANKRVDAIVSEAARAINHAQRAINS